MFKFNNCTTSHWNVLVNLLSIYNAKEHTHMCALTHTHTQIEVYFFFWKLSCHIGTLKWLSLPVARQTSARKRVNSEITTVNIIIISESQPNYKHMYTCMLTHTCNKVFLSKAVFCELHTDISLFNKSGAFCWYSSQLLQTDRQTITLSPVHTDRQADKNSSGYSCLYP